nr:hypothetical protein [uncultured Duganella sp.]
MKTSPTSRLLTAIVAIFSLLFMQLAVAAYDCPGKSSGGQTGVSTSMTVAMDMGDCSGMDAAQPTLCHSFGHGDLASHSTDKTPPVPDVPAFVPVVLIFDLHLFDVIPPPKRQSYPPIALTRTSAPPIAIRNCCFRI